MGHRLSTDESPLIEEPPVLTVELLERVVRQHHRIRAISNLQEERVTASDHAGWRRDDFARVDRFVERRSLRFIDAIWKGRVDDDRDCLGTELIDVGAHRIIELLQARQRATFCREVGAVYDDVVDVHATCKSTSCVVIT